MSWDHCGNGIEIFFLWSSLSLSRSRSRSRSLSRSLSLIVVISEVGELEAVEVERLFRLAEQCMERAKSFTGRRLQSPGLSTTISTTPPPPYSLLHQPVTPITTEETPGDWYTVVLSVMLCAFLCITSKEQLVTNGHMWWNKKYKTMKIWQ